MVLLTALLKREAGKSKGQKICMSPPLNESQKCIFLLLQQFMIIRFLLPLKPVRPYVNIRCSLQRHINTRSASCSFSRHWLSTLSVQGTLLGPGLKQWTRWTGALPRSFPSSEPALDLTLWPFVHGACLGSSCATDLPFQCDSWAQRLLCPHFKWGQVSSMW